LHGDLSQDAQKIASSSLTNTEEKETKKRNIQKEWFDYLDDMAFDCYSAGRSLAVLPHKKLMTFGAAAVHSDNWPMCGNWIEGNRLFKMDMAGVKRRVCLDADRADRLVMTEVVTNQTPKVLSAKHVPEWLGDDKAMVIDFNENRDLALAHGWENFDDVDDAE
jgi:hypothetical protein